MWQRLAFGRVRAEDLPEEVEGREDLWVCLCVGARRDPPTRTRVLAALLTTSRGETLPSSSLVSGRARRRTMALFDENIFLQAEQQLGHGIPNRGVTRLVGSGRRGEGVGNAEARRSGRTETMRSSGAEARCRGTKAHFGGVCRHRKPWIEALPNGDSQRRLQIPSASVVNTASRGGDGRRGRDAVARRAGEGARLGCRGDERSERCERCGFEYRRHSKVNERSQLSNCIVAGGPYMDEAWRSTS